MNLCELEDRVLAEEQLLEVLGDKNKEEENAELSQFDGLTAEKIPSPDLAISVREASRFHSMKSVSRSHIRSGYRIEWDRRSRSY